eukprot:8007189-Heterocapsa_arctica.AAC.1
MHKLAAGEGANWLSLLVFAAGSQKPTGACTQRTWRGSPSWPGGRLRSHRSQPAPARREHADDRHNGQAAVCDSLAKTYRSSQLSPRSQPAPARREHADDRHHGQATVRDLLAKCIGLRSR